MCQCGAKQPTFGLPGEEPKDARCCSLCPTKPHQAINVVKKRCMCRAKRPTYALPGEEPKDARWCSLCPTKPRQAINVRDKRCE